MIAAPAIGSIAAFLRKASIESLARELPDLSAAASLLVPDTMIAIPSVPRDNADGCVAAARNIRMLGFNPVPHIAARRFADAGQVERLLRRLHAEAGVTRLFVVGGERPKSSGTMSSAHDLIATVRPELLGFTHLGFAAYPEAHPAIPSPLLNEGLHAKIALTRARGMIPFVITQFAFAAAPILDWLAVFRTRDMLTEVRIGLAGPAGVQTLIKYARICGIGASVRSLVGNGASIARLLIETGPDAVIRDLIAAGIVERLGPVEPHLFSFGGVARTARWIDTVSHGRIALQTSSAGFRLME